MVPYSPTNVYVLARRFPPVSRAQQRRKPRLLFSFVAEAISTDVIKPASRLRVARVTVQDDVYERIYVSPLGVMLLVYRPDTRGRVAPEGEGL